MKYPILFLLSAALVTAQSWADRAEYDMALAVRAEAAPAARLKLLEDWKGKYPNSQMRHARAELALAAAQSLNDSKSMLQAAADMVAADPNSFSGLFWVSVLQPGSGATSPESYAKTAAASKKVLEHADKYFASPASGFTADAARTERTRLESMQRRILGWVAWQQGNVEAAEKELRLSIESDPASAVASAWLGTMLATQKTPERQTEAIWHLARAAFLDGDGALPGPQRQSVRQLLDSVYASYHGAADGLDEVGQKTRTSALPVAGFKVETAAAVALRRQDEEMARTNPELFEWVKIRRRLLAPDGDAQLQAMMTGGALPRLTGFVVKCTAGRNVNEVVLGLTDAAIEEVLLKLETPLPNCAPAGTRIQFDGVPTAFIREPFLFTISTKPETMAGWTLSKP